MADNQRVQQQKLDMARAEIQRCLIDFDFLGRRTSQDIYINRRAKELLNAGNGGIDELRRTLWQLKHDFDHLAVATANSIAVRRRDSLATLLETL